jgi:hypothetical protein
MKQLGEERVVFSITGTGKTEYPHAKELRPLCHAQK